MDYTCRICGRAGTVRVHRGDEPGVYFCDEHWTEYDGSPAATAIEVRPSGETVSPKPDLVRHPAHYTGGIECWDYITSHSLGFLEGNVIKYVTRYKKKNGLEDLLKARQYLERLIKENGGTPLTEF